MFGRRKKAAANIPNVVFRRIWQTQKRAATVKIECVCAFRVSECTECKMPVQSLAKVFGPTIVGYSSAEAEPMKMFAETAKQSKVSLL